MFSYFEVKKEDRSKYDQFIIDNKGNFTQSSFYSVWQEGIGNEVICYEFKKDDKLVGYIQIIILKSSFNQKLMYAPYGPIFNFNLTTEDIKELRKIFKKICKNHKSIFLRLDFPLNQEGGVAKVLKKAPEFSYVGSIFQPREEWVLNISDDTEKIFDGFHKKHRYHVRLAERHGYHADFYQDNFIEYFDEFYTSMKETADRNEFNLHPKKYYETVFNNLPNAFYSRILNKEGELLCCSIILPFGDTAMYLYGASTTLNEKISGTHMMHYENIKYLKQNYPGVIKYNFGGIGDHMASLTKFKKRFGGEILKHSSFYDIINTKILYFIFLIKKYIK